MGFEDAHAGSERDPDSPIEREASTMPTMYSNTFLGSLSVSSDEKVPSPDRRPSTVPRDPVTGKVDVSTRPNPSFTKSYSLMPTYLLVEGKITDEATQQYQE